MERLHIIVHGRVQGVGFRYHTRIEASRLGLTGYVRNLSDGTVEIVVEGSPQSLNQLIEWTRQGPPTAEVKQVDFTYNSSTGEFGEFLIER